MFDFKTMWRRYQPIRRSLTATYLWFVAFLTVFALIVAIPFGFSQPVVINYELPFNAPSDENWTVEELENQLQVLGENFVVISGKNKQDHDSDFIITWNTTVNQSEIGSDPDVQRIHAFLREQNVQTVGGMRITLGPASAGASLSRATSPAIWLPFALVLLAFFHWQQRCKNAIAQPAKDELELKAVLIALAVSVPLAPFVGLLVGLMSPETADRIPSVANAIHDWQLLLAIIVLIPLAEEIIFRGWLLERLSQVMAPSIALLISAVAFSAIHPMGLVANLIFLIPGLVWGYLWLRYRSLLVCTVAHGSYNATAILIASLHHA